MTARRLAISIIVVLFARGLSAQDCNALATDGIADTLDLKSAREISLAYRSWFCNKQFRDDVAAKEYKVNGVVPFEGIPVKLGFYGSDKKWSTWYSEVCSDTSLDLWVNESFAQHIKTQNVELARVVGECVKNGLNVWLARASDEKFRIRLNFNAPAVTAQDTRVTIATDSDAVCESSTPLPKNMLIRAPARESWLCSRKRDAAGKLVKSAIQVNVKSSNVPPSYGELTLPELVEIVPPPATPFPLYVEKDMLRDCMTRGGQCGGVEATVFGIRFVKGVIRTQPYDGSNGHSLVRFDIPEGAHKLVFDVVNPYTGADCAPNPWDGNNPKPMIMAVEVDGVEKFRRQLTFAGAAINYEVPISVRDKVVTLWGYSGDGPVGCDDSVWLNVRFED